MDDNFNRCSLRVRSIGWLQQLILQGDAEAGPCCHEQQRKENERLAEWINNHCFIEQEHDQIALRCYPNVVGRKVLPLQKL